MVFTLILLFSFVLFMGHINESGYLKKISNYSGAVFLITLSGLMFWLTSEQKVEVVNVTVLENVDTEIKMSGYFSDPTTFNIVPNHITEIKMIHPRWGSLNDIKFKY
jgi:hypothetical protein